MTAIQRNIGIIGDGRTDRIIFGKIVECILTEETSKEFIDCNLIELQRQTIHYDVEKYLTSWNQQSPPNYQDLVKAVGDVLYSGFLDFANQVEAISNCDILILTTDSEKVLGKADDYFSYGINLFNILSEVAIKFYGKVLEYGYSQENIPLVLPIVTFPSTEIIIAAAKGLNPSNYYGKKPLELKHMIYNASNLSTLSDKDLEDKALNFMTLEGIEKIFNHVPESRHFIKVLSACRISCYL